ncbi:MAG: 30S ribosomal protein S20 [Acidobacteriota bacterium]
MANTKSAVKRIRKTEKQRDRNRGLSSKLRTAVKAQRQAIDAGDAAAARELLPQTASIVDSTARKGVIHRNAAARTNSRLAKAVAALEG